MPYLLTTTIFNHLFLEISIMNTAIVFEILLVSNYLNLLEILIRQRFNHPIIILTRFSELVSDKFLINFAVLE